VTQNLLDTANALHMGRQTTDLTVQPQCGARAAICYVFYRYVLTMRGFSKSLFSITISAFVSGAASGNRRNRGQMKVFTLTKTTISLYFNLIVKTLI